MYVNESNTLQLIALLKKHNIKKVVASPGNTNISFIGSIQDDPFFQIYSCVDERSAAYIACGLSEESNEPVVLSCTGATAARNYPSGLTEAFYRKLPIVAITSSQAFGRVGQLFPQFTDRNVISNDVAKESVQIPYPYSEEEKWSNNIKINKVLLQLKGKDKGPVHINIETLFSSDFSVKTLPEERAIMKFYNNDKLPNIKAQKVCIFVGSHSKFTMELQNAIDEFCEKYNAIVLCDQTSNYKGKYRILGGLVAAKKEKTTFFFCKNMLLFCYGTVDSLQPETVCKHKHFLRRNVSYDEVSPETGQSADASRRCAADLRHPDGSWLCPRSGRYGRSRCTDFRRSLYRRLPAGQGRRRSDR